VPLPTRIRICGQPSSSYSRGRLPRGLRIGGRHLAPATIILGLLVSTVAAQPPVHYLQSAHEPPGRVAAVQWMRGGPVAGYMQPVEITAPEGALISLAHEGGFTTPQENQLHAALMVGHLYRLRVGNIPHAAETEIYPTIEMLNRLYPPPGQKLRFPLPIELTQEELEMAMSGLLVTRVIYLEDPLLAIPEAQDSRTQRVQPISPNSDPLYEADRRGRPMAILRMGSRVPDIDAETGQCLFPTPPFVLYTPPALPEPLPPGAADRGLEQELEPRDYPRLPLDSSKEGRGGDELPRIVTPQESTRGPQRVR
jgi:hypothetical protein